MSTHTRSYSKENRLICSWLMTNKVVSYNWVTILLAVGNSWVFPVSCTR